ncbi:unnamed protein product [Lota lota]
MLSSGVLKHQQHVGLQKVSALAGLAHSSLGPCKSYKFIQEEGSREAALACSCVRLLQSLELSCAVGQLVSETVRTHHGAYGSGSACLLFMSGAWSRAALESLRRGIPAPRLVYAMSEGLDICLQACRKHSVPLDVVNTPPSPSLSTQAQARRPQHKGPGNIKLTHSRYFCEAPASPAQNHRDLGPAARALSHGGVRSMELVLQASLLQSATGAAGAEARCSALDIGRVVTCVVPGLSEDQACVLAGCVVRLPAEGAVVAQRMSGQPLRVALVTGDLCARYRHLGSKSPTGVSHVTDRLDRGGSGGEAQWTASVLTALLRLGVNLVLVSGATSGALSPQCLAHRVLLVDRVRLPALKAIAEATGAVPVTYASQLSERCVGTGVTLTPWRDLGDHQAVSISTLAGAGLATAVLTSCVPAKLRALEDEFWACAHRLHRALQDGALLPGAGVIEMVCVRDLQRHAQQHLTLPGEAGAAPGLYRDTVLMLMADALTDYVATVTANSGQCSKLHSWTAAGQEVKRLGAQGQMGLGGVSGEAAQGQMGLGGVSGEAAQGRVYDNLSVKVEAWRRAMDLVLLVLQTDAEVITGIDPEALRTETDLMLL